MTATTGIGQDPLSIPRAGIVVPPANPTVEPELAALVGGRAVPYTARLPVVGGLDLEGRLARYNGELYPAIQSLAGLGPAAVLVACTGSSYPLGPDADRRLYQDLSRRCGFPVIGAAGAVRAVLEGLGAARIALVSPYPAWLTASSAAFWSKCGAEVVSRHPVGGDRGIYATDTEAVAAAVGKAAEEDVDAVLVTGTGAPSLAALDSLAGPGRPPLLSSNLCGAVALLQAARAAPPPASTPAHPALDALVAALRTTGCNR